MKKYLSMLFNFSLFCIFLLILCGSPVMAAPQSEDDDETDTDISSVSGYEFTVERGTLTMPDGVKLAVSYWMPGVKKPGEKFPVFFEMNGYRKDDLCYLSWDYPVGAYFARHGYVVAKVDLRGTGDSGGVIPEAEYSEQELSDGVEIINQLSRKEWSNGKVGMYGLSWGAFNSLMVARRKPPALKAILIAHASDDLYYQDVHFIDGVMHTDVWEAMIDTYNALPDTKKYALTPEFFTNRFDRPPWHFKCPHGSSPARNYPCISSGGCLTGTATPLRGC
jgi:predicted acyl esterase